jgi:hypothetical protein
MKLADEVTILILQLLLLSPLIAACYLLARWANPPEATPRKSDSC